MLIIRQINITGEEMDKQQDYINKLFYIV